MNQVEVLKDEAWGLGILTLDWDFGDTQIKGLYCDGVIAVSNRLENRAEEAAVLAEELGHHLTAGGVILDQGLASNRKQEMKGRAWGYNRLVGLCGIVAAYQHGCRNRYELAEFLGVPEDYVSEAVTYYKNKYGLCTTVDNYTIYFDPLGVMEII